MSILSKKEILERVKSGNIKISPELDTFQLQAHAIDLRLGYTFMIPKSWHMTERGRESMHIDHYSGNEKGLFDVIELEKGQFFDLLPGEYVLTATLESITWPADLMSVLYPRSSTNRRGMSLDLTGIVDAGYEGQLIIPIRNNTTSQSIRLYPGERICQITFQKLSDFSPKPDGTYHQKDVIDGFLISQKNKKEVDYLRAGTVLELKKDFKVQF
jgi:dCTP deaminase